MIESLSQEAPIWSGCVSEIYCTSGGNSVNERQKIHFTDYILERTAAPLTVRGMIRTLAFCLKSLKTITKGYNLSIKKYTKNEIMDKLEQLIKQIKVNPEIIEFQQVITVIEEYYSYTASQFINGPGNDCIINKAGENEGSCKIFSFALDQHLDETQTLHCFGQYFRNDVLNYPENTDHSNIRNFMKYGWKGITFEASALNY